MAPTPIRIALLSCDTPIDPVRQLHGDYLDIFSSLLTRSLPPGVDKDIFVLDNYDVVHKMEYPAENDAYDALLITGSPKSAYEDVEWIHKLVEYIKDIAKQKPMVKIVGICFGHQIVGLALGGSCVRNNGIWEVGPTNVNLSEIGQKVFGEGKEVLHIQQFHSDHVPTVPTDPFPFQCLGSTDLCANQGMVLFYGLPSHPSSSTPNGTNTDDRKSLVRKIHILTVQGHPEFHRSIMSRLIDYRAGKGILSPEIAGDARARNELEVEMPGLVVVGNGQEGTRDEQAKTWVNDGLEVAEIIWEMLGL